MTFRQKVHEIIFGTDTPAGKLFDIVILWAIILSVIIVMLESISSLEIKFKPIFFWMEMVFTGIFTVEYFLRIYVTPRPRSYIFSFWGVIDFLAIMPTYLSIFFAGTQYLLTIRTLRLLRVFRIFKLGKYLMEAQVLIQALWASSYKITVFLGVIFTLALIMGTLMYVIEGRENGYTSIPESIYWTIVTITTVGYGDIVPKTVSGKFLASIMMLMGYAIIAVPTGIVTVELSRVMGGKPTQCPSCQTMNTPDSEFCKKCGHKIQTSHESP
jgi:voltage-gated potassium channel